MSSTTPSTASTAYTLPAPGNNPGSNPRVTTPGSFACPPSLAPGPRGAHTFSSPDTPQMPGVSAKTAWDFLPEGWRTCEGEPEAGTAEQQNEVHASFIQGDGTIRHIWYTEGFEPLTQLEHARLGVVTPQMQRVSEREPHLTPAQVRDEVGAGRMVIPANTTHLKYQLDPMCIGRASTTKVNANLGASPVSSGTEEELDKLRWAVRWGADTIMDLSTGGDLDACREAFIQNSTVPIGTVPIYSMILGRRLEDLDETVILDTVRHQAEQGVDYFTIHGAVLKEHLKLANQRLIGLVSRGGSLLAKWMMVHNQQNPMFTAWENICAIMRLHDVTFSIGDGCRPGGLADATDAMQLTELVVSAGLTERAWRMGVQVMVEGPGHVPLDQIEYNMKLQRHLCHGAPFYVLGPLTTDIFPGYDHITSAIGATNAAYHGAAMLCYVTPKEHLGLPKRDDVKQGCIAYKISAHAADVALGLPGARDADDAVTQARAALNWEKHFELSFDPDTARAFHDEDMDVDTDFCAMCGHDWCAVRISKEIGEWMSGKADGFKRERVTKSAALTPDQQKILEDRGYLDPDEIHRLAHKTRKVSGAEPGKKAACHSDNINAAEKAIAVQQNAPFGDGK